MYPFNSVYSYSSHPRRALSNERIRLNRLSNKVSIQVVSFNDSSGLSIDPLIDWFHAHFAFAYTIQYALVRHDLKRQHFIVNKIRRHFYCTINVHWRRDKTNSQFSTNSRPDYLLILYDELLFIANYCRAFIVTTKRSRIKDRFFTRFSYCIRESPFFFDDLSILLHAGPFTFFWPTVLYVLPGLHGIRR